MSPDKLLCVVPTRGIHGTVLESRAAPSSGSQAPSWEVFNAIWLQVRRFCGHVAPSWRGLDAICVQVEGLGSFSAPS